MGGCSPPSGLCLHTKILQFPATTSKKKDGSVPRASRGVAPSAGRPPAHGVETRREADAVQGRAHQSPTLTRARGHTSPTSQVLCRVLVWGNRGWAGLHSQAAQHRSPVLLRCGTPGMSHNLSLSVALGKMGVTKALVRTGLKAAMWVLVAGKTPSGPVCVHCAHVAGPRQ